MNKSTFGTQPILLLLTLAMIVGCVGAGIGLVLTNQERERVGQEIRKLEARREVYRKDVVIFENKMRTFTEHISLQKLVERHHGKTLHRLDPNGSQVMVVSRTNTGMLAASSVNKAPVAEPTRFGVLDIAFMVPATDRDSARQ